MAGRSPKLNKKFIEEAKKLIEAGNYATTVCDYMGVSQTAWYRWIQDAEEDIKNGEKTIKVEFVEMLKKAEATAEMRNIVTIQKASQDNWQASAWFLERKFFDRWGRKEKQTIEHSGTINNPMSQLTVEELRKLANMPIPEDE